ncbi:hypothetical protein [Candidatus Nitronereus thalassa]|uniref:Carboxypeptidase regulatory-like domain-containing protein n=1 Tax=Candidatus Nitronereus thalassa TaxID=3020898 RepID=A0ABU3K8T9_9BACT|nr:hypothetical protein [Candidatus Nitronereus thalassa]MDT7042810.1 hypothetical protein [Candidatus Nitronereus thalassa]
MRHAPMFDAKVSRLTKTYLHALAIGVTITLISMGLANSKALAISSSPPIVDHVTIQSQGDGFPSSYTIPIYQVGDIRFLSAGIGLEERKAAYPSFPLKLIFAQAGGALVAGVSVTVQDASGTEILKISGDQVSGPWLFLDLIPGTYRVTAARGDGNSVTKTIQLQKGSTKSIHLHWRSPNKQG